MNSNILGVGELGTVIVPGEFIKTLALGSCIAAIFLDPKTHGVGMVHIALPDSKTNEELATKNSGYFANTGIPALIEDMKSKGASPDCRRWIVKLVGGANVMDQSSTFNIGKRNALAIKKILWQYGMGPRAEDIGKNFSRTVSADVDTGKVVVTSPGRGSWEV